MVSNMITVIPKTCTFLAFEFHSKSLKSQCSHLSLSSMRQQGAPSHKLPVMQRDSVEVM